MRKIKKAYFSLKEEYRLNGLCIWDVNPVANEPYEIGVSLSWPNKLDDDLRKEIELVRKIASETANSHELESLVRGPQFAAGGAFVMYVGLK